MLDKKLAEEQEAKRREQEEMDKLSTIPAVRPSDAFVNFNRSHPPLSLFHPLPSSPALSMLILFASFFLSLFFCRGLFAHSFLSHEPVVEAHGHGTAAEQAERDVYGWSV